MRHMQLQLPPAVVLSANRHHNAIARFRVQILHGIS